MHEQPTMVNVCLVICFRLFTHISYSYFSFNFPFFFLLFFYFFFLVNARRFSRCPLKHICPRNCGRSYNHRATMNRHLKYECGVPPRFKCNVCGKLFAQKVNLGTHLISVHKTPIQLDKLSIHI